MTAQPNPLEAVERLSVDEAVRFLDEAGAMLGRGEMPAPGTPFAARWYMAHAVVISTLRSQTEALEKARQDTVNEMADSLAVIPLTPAKKELVKAAFRAAIARMNARAALTPEVKS